MSPEDVTTETTGDSRGRFRRAREPEPSGPADAGTPPESVPPKAKQAGRQMSETTKRILFIIAGVLVLVGSVLGFYLTADVFDDRTQVLVAARPIEPGQTVSAVDFGFDQVLIGSIPHMPWTSDAQFFFDGMVAAQDISAGALVLDDMFIAAGTAPVGVELEVIVPLDLSLVTDTNELADGQQVLLVDPGVDPVESDPGRPRRVVREFTVTHFGDSQMRLFVPPEEWAEWEALLDDVGGVLMVKDLGLGGDAAETTERLDAVWEAHWSAAVEEVEQLLASAEPEAGPGELEVIVSLDSSLSPSGVSDGDLVLLIDPGVAPDGHDAGRRRSVIQTLELENYTDGQMQLFVPPPEWVRWRTLPQKLGGTPLVVPVPEGTDIDEMISSLDAEWEAAWQNEVAEAAAS